MAQTKSTTLGAQAAKLLAWLRRSDGGMLLESQIVGSGLSRAINDLILAGLATMEPHPTVKESSSHVPAAAVVLTDKGRA